MVVDDNKGVGARDGHSTSTHGLASLTLCTQFFGYAKLAAQRQICPEPVDVPRQVLGVVTKSAQGLRLGSFGAASRRRRVHANRTLLYGALDEALGILDFAGMSA